MIDLCSPDLCLDRRFLETSGFGWWYLDLLDARGDGVVCIWSFGLPFLPGRADAARRGVPQPARTRPSLNVAAWRDGRPSLYVLHELCEHEAEWTSGERVRLGDSVLETRIVGDERVVELALDVPVVGGQRLRGEVSARGPALRGGGSGGDTHRWTPLTSGTGRARLDHGGPVVQLEGRAYHDRNDSTLPLHDLGIAHWLWGRVPLEGEELVWYALWPAGGGAPEVVVLRVGERIERLPWDVRVSGPRRALYGMRWWERVEVGDLVLSVDAIVDDGPFYLRFLTRCGDRVGVGEAVRPDQVDVGWQRPLVRMAVQRSDGANSPFLPLFTGPRRGRLRRWLRSLGAA